ncbi:MAG: GntR family transcriptional regulator [Candidatus Lutacidiplasmatales archaeon]
MPTTERRPRPDGSTEARLPNGAAVPWLVLDLEGPVPVFAQLYRQLASAVLNRSLTPGSILPSARQLARDLGIHYHTVNKVYGLLRQDGFAVLDHRRRLLVRRPTGPGEAFLNDWTERQRTLLTEALGNGVSPREILKRFQTLLAMPLPHVAKRPAPSE